LNIIHTTCRHTRINEVCKYHHPLYNCAIIAPLTLNQFNRILTFIVCLSLLKQATDSNLLHLIQDWHIYSTEGIKINCSNISIKILCMKKLHYRKNSSCFGFIIIIINNLISPFLYLHELDSTLNYAIIKIVPNKIHCATK